MRKIVEAVLFGAVVFAFSLFLGAVVQQLWNFSLVGAINGVNEISLWQGWGIVTLVQLFLTKLDWNL
jgi:hypothetical protein